MSSVTVAFATEFLKARRSKLAWAIAAGFSLAPLVAGLFMVILKDPQQASRLGLLGAKAQLSAGVADWSTFWSLLAQAVAVGGGVLFAFLPAWIFGREFAHRTVRTLLAIATPRWAVVLAKSLVVAAWCAGITAWVLLLGFGVGLAVGLPGWSTELAIHAAGTIALAATLITLLQSTTAFAAGVGRGYLLPLAWAVFTIFCAQVLSVLGWGAWFPWAVPALVAGAAGPEGEVATSASLVLVVAVAVVGFAATLVWWERADQTA